MLAILSKVELLCLLAVDFSACIPIINKLIYNALLQTGQNLCIRTHTHTHSNVNSHSSSCLYR